MANDGKTPRIPRELKIDMKEANESLVDLTTKLGSLEAMLQKNLKVKLDIESLDSFVKRVGKSKEEVEDLARSMNKLKDQEKAETKSLDEIISKRKKAEDQIKKTDAVLKRIAADGSYQAKLTKLTQVENELAKVQKERADAIAGNTPMRKTLMKDLKKLEQQQKALLTDTKKTTDLESKLNDVKKEASKTIRDSLPLVDESNKKLKTLGDETGLLQVAMSKVIGPLGLFAIYVGTKLVKAIDTFINAGLALAIDAVFISLNLLKTGFLKIYDLLERTTKATGQFNLQMGATSAGLDETRNAAWQLEGQMRGLTGGALGVGLEMFRESSLALGWMGGDFDKTSIAAAKAGRYLGIGGAAAGELARSYTQLGDSSKNMNRNFLDIADAADAAGVQASQFGKEIVSVKGFMVSFGKIGKKVFLESAAFAKKLGVSLQSLQKFTEVTDSFQSTAEAAAKMNTVFGTQVNALEMMLEQDPSKRLEMVRSQMKMQGKSWESLGRQERKFFAEQMQLSEEEAAGVLNSKLTLDEFRKSSEKKKKQQVNDEERIRRAMSKTAETLLNVGAVMDSITRSMMNLFKPILKILGLVGEGGKEFKSFSEIATKASAKVEKFFVKLSKNDKVMALMNSIALSISDVLNAFLSDGPAAEAMMDKIVGTVGDWAGTLNKLLDTAKYIFDNVLNRENLEWAIGKLDWIAKNLDTIFYSFVAIKGIMGAVTVLGSISKFVTLLGGAGPLLSALGTAANALAFSFAPVIAILSGPVGLVAALAALVAGISYFVTSDTFQNWFKSDSLKDVEENRGEYWMALQKAQTAKANGGTIDESSKKALDKLGANDELLDKLGGILEENGSMTKEAVRDLVEASKNIAVTQPRQQSAAVVKPPVTQTTTPVPAKMAGSANIDYAAVNRQATAGNKTQTININANLNVDGKVVANALMTTSAYA